MVPQLRIVRLDLQGGPEALERLVVATLRLERVPHLFEDLPAEHPGFVERAVQDERVVQRVAGFLEPAELVERFRLRHPCVVVVRVELEALADQLEAFRVQRVVEIGLNLEALVVVLQGGFVAAHLVQRIPDVVPRDLVSRIHLEARSKYGIDCSYRPRLYSAFPRLFQRTSSPRSISIAFSYAVTASSSRLIPWNVYPLLYHACLYLGLIASAFS